MTDNAIYIAEQMPLAIGDIHGRVDLLTALLTQFPNRRLVFLGDYIDRGPDSHAVIAKVRDLVEEGRAVACLGNHDEWMIEVVLGGASDDLWRMNGGQQTLDSYNGDWAALTADAMWMQKNLKPWHIEGEVLFSHAMRPYEGDPQAHIWGRPNDTPAYPLPQGVKVSVHGHTPLANCPLVVHLPDETDAWFIDTGAAWTGLLCALDCVAMRPHLISLIAQPV